MRIDLGISGILRSKTRSALTMTGIAVGVFAVVIISALGSIGTAEIADTLNVMGINSVMVQPAETVSDITLDDEDIAVLAKVDGVDKAMPLMASVTETKLIGQSVDCIAWGVDSQARDIISITPKHGRLVNNSDVAANRRVCVVDEKMAVETYGRSNIVGKTVKVLLCGAYYDFEVIGVAQSGISSLQNALSNIIPDFVYIPYTTMQAITGRTTYDRIAVLVNNALKEDSGVTDRIQTAINASKEVESGICVNNLLQQKSQMESIMGILTLVLSLIAGISLFVSGITVMTTMLVSVNERTREIGIKKSIGAKNKDIMLEFLVESAMLSAMGSGIGTALGLLTALVGCFVMGAEFIVNWGMIFLAFGVSVAMGAIFGVYPARKAAKMKPIDALRN
ncbi:MAG: ABC transporter permease [Ruminiclostridium sp.]